MTWLLVLVLVVFLAVVFIWVGRALLVFSGSRLRRISGLILFVANTFVVLTAVVGGITVAAGVDRFPFRMAERNAVQQLLHSRFDPLLWWVEVQASPLLRRYAAGRLLPCPRC